MHDMSRRSRGAQRRTDDLILFHKPVERATSFKIVQPEREVTPAAGETYVSLPRRAVFTLTHQPSPKR